MYDGLQPQYYYIILSYNVIPYEVRNIQIKEIPEFITIRNNCLLNDTGNYLSILSGFGTVGL